MKEDLINFIHIPKTAGTTFISILRQNFSSDQIFQIDGLLPEDSYEQIKSDEKLRIRCKLLMGHWSIKFEDFFTGRMITRIVFLRDPLDHFLSTYYYIRKTKVHKQYAVANQLDISAFLDYRKDQNLDNLQTRNLAGIATNMTAGTIDFDLEGEKYLEDAKAELKQCKYIFVTEKFDEALRLLKADKILRNIKYTRKNVSANNNSGSHLSEELKQRILHVNRFDSKLYEAALTYNGRMMENQQSSDVGIISRIFRWAGITV